MATLKSVDPFKSMEEIEAGRNWFMKSSWNLVYGTLNDPNQIEAGQHQHLTLLTLC